MPALTPDTLRRLREEAQRDLSLDRGPFSARVVVHMGTCGIAAGARPVLEAFRSEVERRALGDVEIMTTGCAGLCSAEPMATVEVRGSPAVLYGGLTAEKAAKIVATHVAGGQVVTKDVLDPELPFFTKQTLVVLRKKGHIDPERIEHAIARDGYAALERALFAMTPEGIVAEVTASGLRGRGGAGFPTGRKWAACLAETRTPKYVVGNCDEGDPGAYMDRSLLESDPHAVVEGIAIAARAIGASKGFVYVRTEYPLAIERLRRAIEDARRLGLLGENVLGSGFAFELEIREGSGAFVCGEETSLLRSIEGAIPEPRQRPPFPVQSGLWGKPTVINNVETLANVPAIVLRGACWFAGLGTKSSKGTKIFSLVGKINRSGLIEVPMGITLREIVEEIGGGIPGGKRLKAVQTGGPSGGCIPASLADVAIDYESLGQVGSMMGSGGMIVMDEETCVVDVARFFLQFTNDESCGKCSACRDGSAALLEVLTRIIEGQGREEDLEFLDELARAVKDASMCGLGQTLPNPVLSTLRYFREEYLAHIRERRCPALVCKSLVKYWVDPDLCPGCVACLKACPAEAIRGSTKHIHVIDQGRCTKCGQCLEVCPPKVSAVRKLSGRAAEELVSLPEPVPVKQWREERAAAKAREGVPS
jgi:NADH-quinone oxidoreductase subunit F/NADP-reducing hydrogenase subunit HndC